MRTFTITILSSAWLFLTAYALLSGKAQIILWVNSIIVCTTLIGVSYIASIEDE